MPDVPEVPQDKMPPTAVTVDADYLALLGYAALIWAAPQCDGYGPQQQEAVRDAQALIDHSGGPDVVMEACVKMMEFRVQAWANWRKIKGSRGEN